ncbi:zinc-dependent alcohol dehydrogenase family protein [Aureimonas phyllosphaerae]|uniref:NADPH:quinone reductase-like Zn-dependent oxidoreductase n=1 Tax=Aureimonas phyllosphaerae TaxID=1166078 RepID=A0A7W6FUU5_9HYPH|nr:NAD(P)-dependent alcohol dehydrogenase [Aureimonas phyllosphaerae]MBB3936120.1 NADPH:quinone reductase-like Zn-dependent oxidoreductase [Aureimonas phyllosphaerae]MBB3960155.1 NADPH:quinone reductase-like Zn-dependent oxidoreductase [Aureimonas phyllosphaerae]SFF33808.1 NADPH:quinone reductase [Aureimonas phyllosphaerae]
MKAMALRAPGGLDRIVAEDRPDPGRPGPGEIRVALHGGSLNYHDLSVATGKMKADDGRILLADGAGVVESVGEGVSDFAPGDLVVSCFFPDWQDGAPTAGDFARTPGDGIDGFARDVAVLPATAFTKAPKGYDAVEAATITTAGLTAWRALVGDGGLKAGDTVLLLGTGGVSIWALQIARMFGARVAITSSSDEKLERARQLGAEFTLNYRSEPEWGRRIREWTGGAGVDHVVEVGGPGTLAQSIEAVRIGGHISLIGVLTGFSGEVPTGTFMTKQARLQGLIVGSRRQQQDFVRALEANGVRPVVDRRFPLADLAEAFRHEEGASHFGKIGIEW